MLIFNERLSPCVRPTSDSLYVYHNEYRPASIRHGSPAFRWSPADVYASGKYLYCCRYTFNESDFGQWPGNTHTLILQSCFDLNSIPSLARRQVKI
ncbi:hypothetical protein DPMN_120201 [Dreissena polymorpha]|uniref:Uncharacterized protein n=1 Tax=Dreissena polymorpha TaxID=45954 RepID=A0A9D4JNB9_DREPO|nr:hypothetical protein DPMN_120201 [Dreissena polymorpha]